MEGTQRTDGGCIRWIVAMASFMAFIQVGFSYSIGLLLPSIVSHFQPSRAEAALTGSIMTCLTLGVGPLVATLIRRWGHTVTSVLHSLMATSGLLFAALYIQQVGLVKRVKRICSPFKELVHRTVRVNFQQ